MITFIIPKYGDNYYKMIEQYNWLSDRFGNMTYDMKSWELTWHEDSDDWNQIRCYDESIATLFKLAYPNALTIGEWNAAGYKKWVY